MKPTFERKHKIKLNGIYKRAFEIKRNFIWKIFL